MGGPGEMFMRFRRSCTLRPLPLQVGKPTKYTMKGPTYTRDRTLTFLQSIAILRTALLLESGNRDKFDL